MEYILPTCLKSTTPVNVRVVSGVQMPLEIRPGFKALQGHLKLANLRNWTLVMCCHQRRFNWPGIEIRPREQTGLKEDQNICA